MYTTVSIALLIATCQAFAPMNKVPRFARSLQMSTTELSPVLATVRFYIFN